MEEKKPNIFKKLNDLFSSKVILQKIGDKKLKVTDLNGIQGDGSNYVNINNYNVHRGVNVNGIHNEGGIGRYNLYREYETMDRDTIINSALDIYADESTTKNYDGNLLEIFCKDETIKQILINLFYDIMNVEQNIWSWIRHTCKYGDFYLYNDIRQDVGIVNVVSLSPYIVERYEKQHENGRIETVFALNEYNTLHGVNTNKKEYKEYQISHFRLLGDFNFYPYGTSILEGSRKEWKKLVLMEDAMLIHRITRASDRRVFYIDVGNVNPNDIKQYMELIKNESKRTPFVDKQTGDYNLRYNIDNITEDFYFPVRGDKNGTKVENLPGLQYQTIDDINYLKNRVFAGLKISKAFLGFEEETGEKSSVAAQDIRLARTIDNIQRQFISEFYKIAWIHLTAQGYKRSEIIDFELKLNTPSLIYEQEQLAIAKERINTAEKLKDLNLVSYDYIYKNILKLTEDEIAIEKEKLFNDLKDSYRQEIIKSEGFDPETQAKIDKDGYLNKRDVIDKDDIDKYNFKLPDSHSDNQESDDEIETSDGEVDTSEKDLGGRPEEGPKYKSHDNTFGYDTLGGRELKQALKLNKNIGNKGKNYGKKSNFEGIDELLDDIKFLNE